MKDIKDLEEYIKQTDDFQLGLMVEIVKKYDSKIPKILNEIKTKHIKSDNKEDAEIIFSTVHRSKGMEYDEVKLATDFIDEKKIQYLQDEYEGTLADKIKEEINLLYVAITRTKNILLIPENHLPASFVATKNIIPLPVEETENNPIDPNSEIGKEIQKKYPKIFTPWTPEQDEILIQKLNDNVTIKEIATKLERSTKAVRSRMNSLEIQN